MSNYNARQATKASQPPRYTRFRWSLCKPTGEAIISICDESDSGIVVRAPWESVYRYSGMQAVVADLGCEFCLPADDPAGTWQDEMHASVARVRRREVAA